MGSQKVFRFCSLLLSRRSKLTKFRMKRKIVSLSSEQRRVIFYMINAICHSGTPVSNVTDT